MNTANIKDHFYTNLKDVLATHARIIRQGGRCHFRKYRVAGNPVWRLRIQKLSA